MLPVIKLFNTARPMKEISQKLDASDDDFVVNVRSASNLLTRPAQEFFFVKALELLRWTNLQFTLRKNQLNYGKLEIIIGLPM